MASAQQNLPCLYCRQSFRVLSTYIRHLKTHEGQKWVTCSVCGQKKAARCVLEFKQRKEHRCQNYEVWPWQVTRFSLQQTLLQGIGLPESAFQRLWDAAGTGAPVASGSQEPAQVDSSSEEECNQLPVGEPLPMNSDSTAYQERFPLGVHKDHQDIAGDVSLYVPHVEAVQMDSQPHDYYRVPAIHLASGAPVYLVAPTSIPCPGLLFRDYPAFAPVPVMSPLDLKDWKHTERRTVQVMCEFYD